MPFTFARHGLSRIHRNSSHSCLRNKRSVRRTSLRLRRSIHDICLTSTTGSPSLQIISYDSTSNTVRSPRNVFTGVHTRLAPVLKTSTWGANVRASDRHLPTSPHLRFCSFKFRRNCQPIKRNSRNRQMPLSLQHQITTTYRRNFFSLIIQHQTSSKIRTTIRNPRPSSFSLHHTISTILRNASVTRHRPSPHQKLQLFQQNTRASTITSFLRRSNPTTRNLHNLITLPSQRSFHLRHTKGHTSNRLLLPFSMFKLLLLPPSTTSQLPTLRNQNRCLKKRTHSNHQAQ